MALTRKYLKEIGIEPEKIDLIIEQHAETVDGLKSERDEFKEKASEVNDLKAEIKTLKEHSADESEWKEKFDKVSSDFEAYKVEQANEKTKTEKIDAYKAILKEAGVSDSFVDLIVKGTDLESIEYAENKITNADALTEKIKEEYKQCIVTTDTSGVSTQTPPPSSTPDKNLDELSMDEYIKARSK